MELPTVNGRRASGKMLNRVQLSDVMEKLAGHVPGISAPDNSTTNTTAIVNDLIDNNTRIEIKNMSPRKRILLELEQVSLDEVESIKKDPRIKNTENSHSSSNDVSLPGNMVATNSDLSIYNGNNKDAMITQDVRQPVSSYSIASLLGDINSVITNDSDADSNNNGYNPNKPTKTPSRNATPASLQNNLHWSPSTSSPDLTPNHEQAYARYRPYSVHVQYPTPPPSTEFNSYVSVPSRGPLSPSYSTSSSINYGRNDNSSDLTPSLLEEPYSSYRPYNVQYPLSFPVFHSYMSMSSRGSYSTKPVLFHSSVSTRFPNQFSTQESSSPLPFSPSSYSQTSLQHFGSNKSVENSADGHQYSSPMPFVKKDLRKKKYIQNGGDSVATPKVTNEPDEKVYQPQRSTTTNSSVSRKLEIESKEIGSTHPQAYHQNLMFVYPPPHHPPPPTGFFIPPPPYYYHSLAVAGFYCDCMQYAFGPTSRLTEPLLPPYVSMHQQLSMNTNGPSEYLPYNQFADWGLHLWTPDP